MSNITVGGVLFAIYGTSQGAREYFAGSAHGAAWALLSTTGQLNALATGTRILERQIWAGDPTDPIDKSDFASQPANTQPNQWPRTGLLDRNGDVLDSTTIPLDVRDASYEVALDVSSSTSTIQTQTLAREEKRIRTRDKVDVIETEVETEFFANTSQSSTRFPIIVNELIGIWLASNQATALTSFSGTDVTSSFTDEDVDFGFAGHGGLP